MSNLLAFFDDSGSIQDPKVDSLTLAGAIASPQTWSSLGSTWAATLTSYGVSRFRMTEYSNNRGAFEAWQTNPGRRDAFMKELIDEVVNHDVAIFGATTMLRAAQTRLRHPNEEIHPYRHCVTAVVHFCSSIAAPEREVDVVFAQQPEFDGLTLAEFDRIRFWNVGVASVSPLPARESAPLQIADLIAWEVNKRHREPGRIRETWKRLSPLVWGLMTFDQAPGPTFVSAPP
jgi:hypothetical protein